MSSVIVRINGTKIRKITNIQAGEEILINNSKPTFGSTLDLPVEVEIEKLKAQTIHIESKGNLTNSIEADYLRVFSSCSIPKGFVCQGHLEINTLDMLGYDHLTNTFSPLKNLVVMKDLHIPLTVNIPESLCCMGQIIYKYPVRA